MIPVKPHIAEGARVASFEEYERLYRESLEDPVRCLVRSYGAR